MRLRMAGMVVAVAAATTLSCIPRMLPSARILDSLPPEEGTLAVHLLDGHLAVLTAWAPEGEPPVALRGVGTLYDARRRPVVGDSFLIPYDSIALLETTVVDPLDPMIGESLGGTALAVFTGLTGALTLSCLADPKSCFGSCPTIYDHPDADRPVAESFSGSVARVLEARDIDALPTVRPRDGQVRLRMRNEALETHAVRSFRLLTVAPGPAGVAAADDGFFQLRRVVTPTACTASEGDCLADVRARDGAERRSWADSVDLAAPEVVELEFPAVDGPAGLLLSARHTFVSTFLFYQMLAYLGRDAGATLAALERGDRRLREGFERGVAILGEMEVSVARGGRWVRVASFDEPGPLATDTRLIPLPDGEGPVRVRLSMTRGYWRLDAVELALLGPRVEPLPLEPALVERDGRPDPVARSRLLDPAGYLVTYPGDAYDMVFDMPADRHDDHFFLDATGYYYEWMRREWMDERDPRMVALFHLRPRAFFRRLAPAFKESEGHMEALFWASRVGRGG